MTIAEAVDRLATEGTVASRNDDGTYTLATEDGSRLVLSEAEVIWSADYDAGDMCLSE